MTNRFVLLLVVLLAGCGQGNEEVLAELIKDVERIDSTKASSEYVIIRLDSNDSRMESLVYEINTVKAEIERAQRACAPRWPSGPVGCVHADGCARDGMHECAISCINDDKCVCESRNRGEAQ